MAITIPDEGKIVLLNSMVMGSPNWRVKLYKVDRSPLPGDTYATYDAIKADFSSADDINNKPPVFPAPATVPMAGGPAQIVANAVQFQHNGEPGGISTPNDIYGYFVIDTATNKLLWAERLSTMTPPTVPPVTLQRLGDTITISPTLTLDLA